MDLITSKQHASVAMAWRQSRTAVLWPIQYSGLQVPESESPNTSNMSESTQGAKRVLHAVMIANVVLWLRTLVAQAYARIEARRFWPGSFRARWIAYYLPGATHTLREGFQKPFMDTALKRCVAVYSLTSASLEQRRWYTFVTSSFFHIDAGHLMSNMFSLWGLGSICTRIHGVTAEDMVAITLGASVCSSAATLIHARTQHRLLPLGWAAMGASGVVCAFGSVAAFGAPLERLQVALSVLEVRVSAWAFVVLQVTTDLVAMLLPWLPPTRLGEEVTKLKVGHAAHVAGAFYGAAYYFVVLRPRQVASNEWVDAASAKIAQVELGVVDTCEHDEEQVNINMREPETSWNEGESLRIRTLDFD